MYTINNASYVSIFFYFKEQGQGRLNGPPLTFVLHKQTTRYILVQMLHTAESYGGLVEIVQTKTQMGL